MPELPEVETIRRGLEKCVTGHTITAACVLLPKAVRKTEPAEFVRTVSGKTIEKIGRRGKYLLIFLSSALCLVVHLRMTGCFEYTPAETPCHPHTRIILHLDRGMDLRYLDMRTFGGMELTEASALYRLSGLSLLGPEPLSREFTPAYLNDRAKNRTGPVKGFLLNQTIAAGIGNIYADESLFLACIHPERPAGSLSLVEWETLWQAIRLTLQAGIDHKGTSVQNYLNLDGRPGSYQNRLQVYQKTGQPCTRCKTPIAKSKTAGRGTHFCPICQPREPLSG